CCVSSRHSSTRSRRSSTDVPDESGREQLRVETLAELARLAPIGWNQIVAEQLEQLLGCLTQQTLRRLCARANAGAWAFRANIATGGVVSSCGVKEGKMASEGFWAGWVWFAGLFMIVIGFLDFFQGLIAVIRDKYYVLTPQQIIVFDLTTWGWIMLIWGIIVALAGCALLAGQGW